MFFEINYHTNFVELYFDDIPSSDLRKEMKELGWWYNYRNYFWFNFITSDNIAYAEKIVRGNGQKVEAAGRVDNSVAVQNVEISFSDVIVLAGRMRCGEFGHHTETVNATLNIMDPKGRMVKRSLVMGYCTECEKYYVQEEDLLPLKELGVIVARIVDPSKSDFNTAEWSAESLLMQVGYSVSQEKALSLKQRQEILANVIDCGLMSAYQIINHIDFLISLRTDQDKFLLAIEKWKTDREFVSGYKSNSRKNITVNYQFRDHKEIKDRKDNVPAGYTDYKIKTKKNEGGTKIKHRTFGVGTVKRKNGEFTIVSFENCGERSLNLDLCIERGLITFLE